MTEKTDIQKRELEPDEQKRLDKYLQRRQEKPAKIKLKDGTPKGKLDFEPVDPDDPLLATKYMEITGTADKDLANHLLQQATLSFTGVASADGVDNEGFVRACNCAMAILGGIKPQDELEAMLAVQMIGVHNMGTECLKRAMLGGQGSGAKEANANQATKMMRTFIAQMEALKNYRTGGQQKMTVEHVHVNEGGQAFVGTVHQGGGASKK